MSHFFGSVFILRIGRATCVNEERDSDITKNYYREITLLLDKSEPYYTDYLTINICGHCRTSLRDLKNLTTFGVGLDLVQMITTSLSERVEYGNHPTSITLRPCTTLVHRLLQIRI